MSRALSLLAVLIACQPPASTASAKPPSRSHVPNARISVGCGPTDAPIETLDVYNHEGACGEVLPKDTWVVLRMETDGAPLDGEPRKSSHPINVCRAADQCEPILGAVITESLDGADVVGEISYTRNGETIRVPFRAAHCDEPGGQNVVCG